MQTIGATSGDFSWTPSETQGPGSYTFDVCVSDSSLSDCETISVTVDEVNIAPVLDVIGNKSVQQGETVSFTAEANDVDDPYQILIFSLSDGTGGSVPEDANITSGGEFSWTTEEDQTLGDYTFDVCVSDELLPVCETIVVTVTEGTVPPPTPSSYYGEIHFVSGDGEPNVGDSLDAYLDDEVTSITSILIGETTGALTYSINVPAYGDMSLPSTVRFEIDGRLVAIVDWVSGGNLPMDIHPPQADAGGAYAAFVDEASLTLSGSADDYLTGDTFSYAWDLDNDGEYDDSSDVNPTFNFTTTGTHEIGLRVTDGQGGVGFDSTQIFIVELSGIEGQVYDGDPHVVTVAGVEAPYTTTVLYGDPGSETPPTDAGTYDVVVNIMDGATLLASVEDELVISQKAITVTANSDQTKVFGEADPTFAYTSSDETVSFTGALDRVAGENVGIYAINIGDLSAGSNYDITFVPANFTITAKPITVTADSGQTKVYGEADPIFSYSSSETVSFTGALGRTLGEDVGSYAINIGDLSAGSNYSITFNPVNFTITAKPITVTADNGQTKVYGEADPILSYSSSETVSFTGGLGRILGEDVGTYAINIGDLSAGNNYNIAFVPANFTITVKPITVTANSGQTKVFGEADPVFTYTSSDETVSFSGALSRELGEDVGTYEITIGTLSAGNNYQVTFVPANFIIAAEAVTVTVDGGQTKIFGEVDPTFTYTSSDETVSFTGALSRELGEDAGDYEITIGTLSAGSNYSINLISADFTITPKVITVTADNGQTKVFGEADPIFTYTSSDETVSFTGELSREPGEDAGDYEITIGTLSAGSNYSINFNPVNFTITAKPITVTADNGQTKDFGEADPIFTYTSSDETVSFTGELSREPGEDAGDYEITIGTLSAGSNYSINLISADFTITPKVITVTADNGQTKVFGEADPVFTYTSSDETVSFTGALSRELGEDVGTYEITIGTLSAGNNYQVTFVPANFIIAAEAVTVTVDGGQTKVFGEADPIFTYTSSDETVSFTGALSREPGEDAGDYEITIGTLSAGSNYSITFVPADFTITAKPITVTADAQSKVYGEEDPELTYQITDGAMVGEDEITGEMSRVAGENVEVYVIQQNTLTAGPNYSMTFVPANFTITAKPITVTPDSAQTKVYGEFDPTFTYISSEASVSFTGVLNRVLGEDAGIYAFTIGTLSAGNNYSINLAPVNFEITIRSITVTADDKTKLFGEDDPELTYLITSGSLVTGDEFTGGLTREAGEDAGDYAIQQGALALSTNYSLTFVDGTLSILYPKHGIDLVAGWNLVSFNIHPASTEIEDVLGSIDGLYSLVYAWDAETNTWLKYDPNVGYGHTLQNLDETMGFWIHMTTDATLVVEGPYPESTNISLSSDGGGWNLVGFPSATALDLPEALTDHGVEDVSIVFAYKASDANDPWKLFEPDIPDYAVDLIQLDVGWGYWVKVTDDASWQIDY